MWEEFLVGWNMVMESMPQFLGWSMAIVITIGPLVLGLVWLILRGFPLSRKEQLSLFERDKKKW